MLRPRFEFHDNPEIAGWITANKYPKQQEIFYYVASLFFIPFFTAVVWSGWLLCSSIVSLLTRLPVHQVLRKYAFAHLPLILILRNIHTPTFSKTILTPLLMMFAVRAVFWASDLSRIVFRKVREAVFYPGSSDIHWGIFAAGMCVSFFVLIGYSDNTMGVLSCLTTILAVSALVWLLWLLYSKILSAIVKCPFSDILTNEVYSSFPLVILLLVSLLFEHRNIVLTLSLASVIAMKIMLIMKPGWFGKLSSNQFHRYILKYALIPALIYVFFYSGGRIHGGIDMFHEGERLAPLNALLRGKIPYRDIYLQHGLFHNAYRPLLASKLFGPTLAADRMLGHLLHPLRYVAFYFLGLQLFKSGFFVLLSVWVSSAMKGYDDARIQLATRYALGIISIAILVSYLLNQRKRLLYGLHLRPLLAGMLATLAVFYSLETGLYTLATGSLFLLIFSTSLQDKLRRRFTPVLSYLAGVFIAFLPFALYFLAHGAIDDLFGNFFIQCRYQTAIWGLRFPPLFSELSKVGSLESLIAFVLSGTMKWYFPILVYLVTLTYLVYQLFRGGFWDAKSNAILLLLVIGGIMFFRTPLGRSDGWHLSGIFFAWLICVLLVERLSTGAWKHLKGNSDLIPPVAWRLFLTAIRKGYKPASV